ncbi:MAG TPA: hypothetical protein VE008_08485 [Burkholderiales bacterium]|nr:hypothetical protein [Burkholderiales bacterium]
MWPRKIIVRCLEVAAVVTTLCSCSPLEPMPLAPGADQVRITKNPADVAGCKAVGNVSLGPADYLMYSETRMRNRVVGLDGNTLFVTVSTEGLDANGAPYKILQEGVAYRCS